MSDMSLNAALTVHGLTTQPATGYAKDILDGDAVVFTGSAGAVWKWLHETYTVHTVPLRSFSMVGGYPLFYLCDAGSTVRCASCRTEELKNAHGKPTAHPNWENPSLHCDECSTRIESAYAEEENPCSPSS